MVALNPDITLFVQIVLFLIIVFIGKKLIIDPVMKTVSARDAKISGLVKDAEEMRAHVESKKAEYETRMAELRADMADYQRKVREETLAETGAKFSALKADMDAKVAAAQAELAGEVEKARASLSSDAKALADMILEKVIGKTA